MKKIIFTLILVATTFVTFSQNSVTNISTIKFNGIYLLDDVDTTNIVEMLGEPDEITENWDEGSNEGEKLYHSIIYSYGLDTFYFIGEGDPEMPQNLWNKLKSFDLKTDLVFLEIEGVDYIPSVTPFQIIKDDFNLVTSISDPVFRLYMHSDGNVNEVHTDHFIDKKHSNGTFFITLYNII